MIKNKCLSCDDVLRTLREHQTGLRGFGLKSLAVFGSTARNEASAQSDIDMLVEFALPVGLFRFLDLKAYLEKLLGRSVDLVTPDALKRQLREGILKEAVHAL